MDKQWYIDVLYGLRMKQLDTKQEIRRCDACIIKWRRITFDDALNKGANDCAFCAFYNVETETEVACVGCPIARATGASYCQNTTYHSYVRAARVNSLDRTKHANHMLTLLYAIRRKLITAYAEHTARFNYLSTAIERME